jgi:hypothetical protein
MDLKSGRLSVMEMYGSWVVVLVFLNSPVQLSQVLLGE